MTAGDLLRRLHEAQRQLPVRLLDVKAIIRRAHRLFAMSLGAVVVGVVAVSGAAAVGVNEVVRPDPIEITGGWRVTDFEETENVDVVPVDFTGAILRIVEIHCDDEPCPVVIASVRNNEEAGILQRMRLFPDEGGTIYVGRRETISDCVDAVNRDLVLDEGVYDTTHTVRWERAEGDTENQLTFVYQQHSTLNVEEVAENCPDSSSLEAGFIATRTSG